MTTGGRHHKILDSLKTILPGLVILCGLYITSLYNFILFHIFTEIFGIVIACGIFIVAWNTRRIVQNGYLLFIGIAYLFVAFLELLHAISYKEMGVFHGYGMNLPTQLWVITRYAEGLSFLTAAMLIGRKIRPHFIFISYGTAISLLLATVFYWNIFPVCYIEGTGLTTFKTTSQYLISLILLASIFIMFKKRSAFDPFAFRLLVASIAVTAFSELTFSLFHPLSTENSNPTGHFLKIISFYLIYKAIIESSLRRPYNFLFKDLKQSEDALRESEKKLNSIFKNMQDAFFRADNEDRVVWASPSAARMLGYGSAEELIGLNFTENFCALPGQRKMLLEKLSKEGMVTDYEIELRRSDGSTIIVSTNAHCYRNQEGEIEGVEGVCRDITERKRIERKLLDALKESKMREAEVSAMLKSSRSILENQNFENAARAIFDSCKNLIGATAGYIAILSQNGGKAEILFLDSGGLSCSVDPNLPMPVRGLRAEACNDNKVVYHNDFANSEWTKYMPEGHVQLQNVLFAPLVIEGQTVALLGLANKPGGFTDHDVRIAAAFGELAAIALQNSRTLELLENSEERFRSVAESANDAIISADAKGNIIFWNHKAETMFGYSADEITGRPLTLIMPEKFRAPHKNGLERIVSKKGPRLIEKTVELAGLTKDGREFPIELSIAAWESGGRLYFTGIIRDITERKQIEEELRKHREQLMDLVEERTYELQRLNEELEQEISERTQAEKEVKLMALFAELNPSPVLRFDRGGKILMANPAAVKLLNIGNLTGKQIESVIPGIEKLDLVACISDGTILSHSAQINDRFFHFTIKGLPELDFGQIYGSDITERKQAEAEAMRASHLAALGELAAGVAHEINNPINGIINYTQILANKTTPGSKEHDIANRIIKEGDRIANIVRNLLSFARDSKEKKHPVNITEILSDTLALIRKQLKKDGIRLRMTLHPELPLIIAQPHQIEQVLLNIISNSRYALNKKFPEAKKNKIIEITGERTSFKDKNYLRITIQDNGCGIPSEILDKIMNPFFTTKPSDMGTGLGLSISHGIISDHGGKITVESKEGEFTKVVIDLPAADIKERIMT